MHLLYLAAAFSLPGSLPIEFPHPSTPYSLPSLLAAGHLLAAELPVPAVRREIALVLNLQLGPNHWTKPAEVGIIVTLPRTTGMVVQYLLVTNL